MATVDIECVCPPKHVVDRELPRHPNGDTVTLRERLDFHSALTIRNAFAWLRSQDADASIPEYLATLTEQYLLFGVESWTLVGEDGKPLEVSKPAIRERLLSHPRVAMVVGDAADALYNEDVLLPLLAMASNSSPPMPTDASTSATTHSLNGHRKPSSPSSTITSLTEDTETTSVSPAGVSNSSRS